ncbi:MAG: TRAP transporter large permease subunit [Betaproteobacteria bacterium]|nr:TRAP transporter large permease subunit [Betaproteobacteria bacterium]
MMDIMAPLMFAGLAAFLLLGYPVAFSLAANGLLFAFVGIELGMLEPVLLQALPQRLFGIMSNQLLIAVPFFTFMGLVLERSGMAEDLLDTIGQVFGPLRGGIAYAVIFVGALLAATTGVIAASVIAMGLISLPIMLRYGYSKQLASGVICASGALAQVIPPSIVLIVLADVLGASVGDMYLGTIIPGFALVGMLLIYVAVASFFKPKLAPALPAEARTVRGWALYRRVLFVMMPPLVLIFLVLGTIFMGIATPSEGGAMGATGALALALIKGRLTWKVTREALESTTKLASFVMFILLGSTVFALTFRAVNGDLWVEHLFDLVPGGVVGFLVVVNVIIFILGCFLDFFEIAFILLPLLGPVAVKMGLDLVWFGVMIGMILQTSFLTPPFGFALFYLRSCAPKEVKTLDIYKGVVPFIGVQLIAVIAVILMPEMVTGMTGGGKKIDVEGVEIRIDAPTYGEEGGEEAAKEEGASAEGAPAEGEAGKKTGEDAEEDPTKAIERAIREGK